MVAFGDAKRCPTIPAIGPGRNYDANGNRTSTGYIVGTGNRMLSDGMYTYQYDAEGNTTRRTCIADGSVTDYTWDYRNRLTEVTDRPSVNGTPTQVVDYIYDVNNHLLEEITDLDGAGSDPASQWFLNDPVSPESQGGAAGEGETILRLTSTTSGGWAVADYYLWGPATDFLLCDEKVTSPTTVDINWTLGDDLNSVRDVAQYNSTTQTTSIVDHRCYSAFGSITLETNAALDLSIGYTGRPLDTLTQLQNNLNRWYFASCGRWLNPDPDEFYAGDPNLYRYCGNRITYRTDPSGLLDPTFCGGNWTTNQMYLVVESLGRIETRITGMISEINGMLDSFTQKMREELGFAYRA